jgi:hypothetical protein
MNQGTKCFFLFNGEVQQKAIMLISLKIVISKKKVSCIIFQFNPLVTQIHFSNTKEKKYLKK